MDKLVSIVIPVFNEAENVPLLMERIHAALNGFRYEAIFVNDGSSDGTRDALEQLRGTYPALRPVHFVRNFGQSAALVAGMRAAEGDYILTADGDLQNDPADFPRMIELLERVDCVFGYRAERHDSWVRKLSSRVANVVRNAILHDGIRDSGCGSKGFRREVVAHIVPFNGAHRFLGAIASNAGFTIEEIPVIHHARVHGTSKYGIGNRLWRGIYDLIGVRWLVRRYVRYEIERD
ncbi:MAG: glycosyltransferase [Candidatus Hydrogenedens sp.]|nr:glycosyltransferase [Candidatus Hydrogenedens sp.]